MMHRMSILAVLALSTLIQANPDQGLKIMSSTSTWNTHGNLTGKYVNVLGSTMILACTGTGASAVLSGFYTSAVGNAEGSYALSGHATSCGNDGQGGFSVAWLNEQNGNSFSATSWTFQAQQDQYTIVLVAPWIMVHETTQDDSWSANSFGLDIFTQQGNGDTNSVVHRISPTTTSD